MPVSTPSSACCCAWLLDEERCGTLQVNFNLLQVSARHDGYYGMIQIMRP